MIPRKIYPVAFAQSSFSCTFQRHLPPADTREQMGPEAKPSSHPHLLCDPGKRAHRAKAQCSQLRNGKQEYAFNKTERRKWNQCEGQWQGYSRSSGSGGPCSSASFACTHGFSYNRYVKDVLSPTAHPDHVGYFTLSTSKTEFLILLSNVSLLLSTVPVSSKPLPPCQTSAAFLIRAHQKKKKMLIYQRPGQQIDSWLWDLTGLLAEPHFTET